MHDQVCAAIPMYYLTVLEIISILVSGLAVFVAVGSAYITTSLWRRSNRPFVTVKIETPCPGNICTPLNLVVTNSGNRPAKCVTLKVEQALIDQALVVSNDDAYANLALRCFTPSACIPVLSQGERRENAFGRVGKGATWMADIRLPVIVIYEDIDGRRFQGHFDLYLGIATGFAGGSYEFKQ